MTKTLNIKDILNIALPTAAISVILYNLLSVYGKGCAPSGSILGVDLKYVGIVFMSSVLAVRFLKQNYLYILLAAGLGAKFYLAGFQILNHAYCPYCLVVTATVLILFVINFKASKIMPSLLLATFGFILFLTVADCSVVPEFQFCPIPIEPYQPVR